jgi:hypothetical protein
MRAPFVTWLLSPTSNQSDNLHCRVALDSSHQRCLPLSLFPQNPFNLHNGSPMPGIRADQGGAGLLSAKSRFHAPKPSGKAAQP